MVLGYIESQRKVYRISGLCSEYFRKYSPLLAQWLECKDEALLTQSLIYEIIACVLHLTDAHSNSDSESNLNSNQHLLDVGLPMQTFQHLTNYLQLLQKHISYQETITILRTQNVEKTHNLCKPSLTFYYIKSKCQP